MKVHAFRLIPGDDLRLSIEKYVSDNNIRAGFILTCVGSLSAVSLRFANQEKTTLLEGRFEIVSLEATLSVNGSHLHMAIANGEGSMNGGHLMPGSLIFTTAEVVIGEIEGIDFRRELDKQTGFRELIIKPL
jgi:predicted DNA-binding protein with PD1-like motif